MCDAAVSNATHTKAEARIVVRACVEEVWYLPVAVQAPPASDCGTLVDGKADE